MNQRGIAPLIIVAIVVVAAVAAGVGIYVATRGGGGAGGGGGGGGGGDIGTATSLSFKIDTSYMGIQSTSTFKGKNIGSANIKMRVEGIAAGQEYNQEYKFIADAGTEQAWVWSPEAGWMDISDYMQSYFDQYRTQFEAYKTQLSGWTGGDYTYTDPSTGATVRIYDIVVNPDLPDSLFRPD